jgi:hypothetical protein
MPLRFVALVFIAGLSLVSTAALADTCVDCHRKVTPNIVSDWQLSMHSQNAITCDACHGDEHKSADDSAKARIPTPETCGGCHADRVAQYKSSKHAAAWAAMKAVPTFHYQPMSMTEGMKGCGACHKIGVKTEAEIATLKREGNGFGTASCDACHTRHTFSVTEAQQPQACETCHMGFDGSIAKFE